LWGDTKKREVLRTEWQRAWQGCGLQHVLLERWGAGEALCYCFLFLFKSFLFIFYLKLAVSWLVLLNNSFYF
jgi:hypothetical protein